MIYIPDRHDPLRCAPWSEAAALAQIQRIVDASVDAFDTNALWPLHARDADGELPASPAASIDFGAAGVIWTLLRLKRDGMVTMPLDFAPTLAGLDEQSRRFNEAAGIAAPSYFLGDAGVLLLQWKELRDQCAANALFALAEGNLHKPSLEALWGSPGTMIAALHMIDDLANPAAQARWIDLLRRGAQILFDRMHPAHHNTKPDAHAWLWTQDMYGSQMDYIGAGHGFAGNLYFAWCTLARRRPRREIRRTRFEYSQPHRRTRRRRRQLVSGIRPRRDGSSAQASDAGLPWRDGHRLPPIVHPIASP